MRKKPFNTDLPRWMRKELVGKSALRSNGTGTMDFELFADCILGFFFLLRISEIEALKWEDISTDTQDGATYWSIRIRHSETDVLEDGILRPLIEIDSMLRPVKTFQECKRMALRTGEEQSSVFVPRLRERVSAFVKTAELANGVMDRRIGPHSLRAGGATALYTQGAPIDAIQRRGRVESLTSHQYLWRDATSRNTLSEVMVKSHRLLNCVRLMNAGPESAPFQQNCETMADSNADSAPTAAGVTTALFLPDDRFAAGSSRSDSCA